MKTIMIILCLLFGFNTYAMQVPLKRDSVEYKLLFNKIDSKVKPIKKQRKFSPLKRTFMIIQIVIYTIVLFFLIAIMVSKR
jgi:hypothetical protein